jgi:metal-responsive CopG/Arc/MetJ family transcriptional regulator
MSKTLISVRLSAQCLAQLDAAARQLGMNRSETINAALRIFPDLISGRCELKYEPEQQAKSNLRGANERDK